MRVGFDVTWTAKGLRATVIKIYDLFQEDTALEFDDSSTEENAELQDDSVPVPAVSRAQPWEVPGAQDAGSHRPRRQRSRYRGRSRRSDAQSHSTIAEATATPNVSTKVRNGKRSTDEGSDVDDK